MRKLFFVFIALALACVSSGSKGQPVDTRAVLGDWEGKLSSNGMEIAIVFHLKNEGGILSGTMDVPEQGTLGLPIDALTFDGENKLTLKISKIGGVYTGKLTAPDQITGVWQQSLQNFPMDLKRQKVAIDISKPQDPKGALPYLAKDVTFENNQAGITLAGTLTYPNTTGPVTTVILITGSGSQDRNETLLGHKPFLVLADHLSRNNIAVLRYDDRGIGGSGGDPQTATTEDYATDVQAAITFLKNQKMVQVSKIGLIGHSEGGIIAPIVATRTPDVAFIVMMAGTGCNGMELVLQQSEAILRASGIDEAAIKQQLDVNREIYQIIVSQPDKALAKTQIGEILVQAGIDQSQADAQIDMLLSPWYIFFLQYDPAPTLEKVKIPVLVLNGTLDLQVPAKTNLPLIEAALIRGGNTQYVIKALPNLNHLFQTATTGLMNEYATIQETLAPLALDTISTWINALNI